MSRRFRSSSGRRGFTLMEAMVSLTILVIVMVVMLTLLFSMRSFAERLQTRLVPRQTSRQSINYLGFYVEGAADLNPLGNNPNALVMWQCTTQCTTTTNNPNQVTYNNLTGTEQGNAVLPATGLMPANTSTTFGDIGTDLITLAVPTDPTSVPVASWPGNQHAGTLYFNYSAGCPDDTRNLQMFQEATGFLGTGNQTYSPVLTLVDSMGNWVYYQITGYQGSTCSNLGGTNEIVHVVMTPGQSAVNIPSGHPDLVSPVSLMTGVRYVCFRVKGGNLQQKQGFFDPFAPNPNAGFSTIVEDVEDLQIAYIYRAAPDLTTKPNVYTYNTSTDLIPATVTPYGVPPQAGLNGVEPVTAWDITNVQGLRISISSRSKALRLASLQISQRVAETINNFRPAVEDRAKGPVDGFDHYRVTTTLMIRNRMLGN
jgi:prepilin-type N-terminal cleavage/methylation domain-containing protein